VEACEAYLDASGTHDGSKVVVVAGCISTKDQWDRLTPDWNHALLDEGVKAVKGVRRLHMKELTAGTGGFRGWTEPQRRRLLTRLGLLLRVRARFIFAHAVPLVEYERLKAVIGPVPLPRTLMLIQCFRAIAKWGDENGVKEIAYFVEDGDEGHKEVDEFMSHAVATAHNKDFYRLKGYAWAGKEVAPLQAADWIAYEVYLTSLRFQLPYMGLARQSQRHARASYLALKEIPSSIRMNTSETMLAWRKAIDEHLAMIGRAGA
jgi:hypothetical protein